MPGEIPMPASLTSRAGTTQALARSLRRLSGARVPLVLVAIETPRGQGRRLLPLLAELGLAAELSPDFLVLLSLGPGSVQPGSEQQVARRVRGLLSAAGTLRITALRICSDSLVSLDDLRDLIALEAPVAPPPRRHAFWDFAPA